MVDIETAFSQQLLDVPIGQRETQIPPNGQHDHLGREPEPDELRRRDRRTHDTSSHHTIMPARGTDQPEDRPQQSLSPRLNATGLVRAGSVRLAVR